MKTVVVTGATSGIGLETAAALMKNGCRVIGLGRSKISCQTAEKELRARTADGELVFFTADLLKADDIAAVAKNIADYLGLVSGGVLHGLVNNAGCVRSWYMTTPEGFEHQFALNHLAGYRLTHLLLPNLLAAGGRVLMTSSGSHRMMRIHWQDVMYEGRYRPLMAYKQSKLCNMLFAFGLNDRYAASGLRAYGIDPGLVHTEIGCKNTGGLVRMVWGCRKSRACCPQSQRRFMQGLFARLRRMRISVTTLVGKRLSAVRLIRTMPTGFFPSAISCAA